MTKAAWTQRYIEPEVMDQPELDFTEHRRALEHLQRFNQAANMAGVMWKPIAQFARQFHTKNPDQPLRILDLASGGGDLLISLAQRAQKARVPCQFIGWDLSPVAQLHATELAKKKKVEVTFEEHDVVNDPFPHDIDIYISTLFFHHLPTETVIKLLEKLSQATRHQIIVNDLVRSKFHYYFVKTLVRFFATSWVVKEDGPISVRAAFTMDEIRQAAHQAGLNKVSITHRFPGRFMLQWTKNVDQEATP